MSTPSLATATVQEIADELGRRAAMLDEVALGNAIAGHIHSAIDELRIACAQAVALNDKVNRRLS